MSDVTVILGRMQGGDTEAAQELLPLIYNELRRIAAVQMSHEKPGDTLQATALVHEVWLRLFDRRQKTEDRRQKTEDRRQKTEDRRQKTDSWIDRQAFLAAASEAMRRILVDVARRKGALKRGGRYTRLDISAAELPATAPYEEVVAVSEALEQLDQENAPAAELVKLHYFAGLSLEESAELLQMSRATAYRTWTYARTFLRAALSE